VKEVTTATERTEAAIGPRWTGQSIGPPESPEQ
jgi:hypothetical protein